ncbi:hypothetical protein [Janthinobacterium fluminis]|uniref:Uncharacterized protein n=1 Tax=Janthinobacterium fluminis TaxID=2987524 RepID=A0ABT5K656_9BURK|nr:hypothetical protein [Janthinobacterium fluminis]MDC8759910.1 hypothetical protein [Janthinobacterium fluminis]
MDKLVTVYALGPQMITLLGMPNELFRAGKLTSRDLVDMRS